MSNVTRKKRQMAVSRTQNNLVEGKKPILYCYDKKKPVNNIVPSGNYVEYPNAQGQVNLLDTVINGDLSIHQYGINKINLRNDNDDASLIIGNTTYSSSNSINSVFIGTSDFVKNETYLKNSIIIGNDVLNGGDDGKGYVTETVAIGDGVLKNLTVYQQSNEEEKYPIGNTCIGNYGLCSLIDSNNTISDCNTALGYNSGNKDNNELLNGTFNTFLGANTGVENIDKFYRHSTAVGADSIIKDDNQIMLGTNLDHVFVPNYLKFSDNTIIRSGNNVNLIQSSESFNDFRQGPIANSIIDLYPITDASCIIDAINEDLSISNSYSYTHIVNNSEFIISLYSKNSNDVPGSNFEGIYGSYKDSIIIAPLSSITLYTTPRVYDKYLVVNRTPNISTYTVHYNENTITTYSNPQFLDSVFYLIGSIDTSFNLPDIIVYVKQKIPIKNKTIKIFNKGSATIYINTPSGEFGGLYGNGLNRIDLPINSYYTFICNETSWDINERSPNIKFSIFGGGNPINWSSNYQYLDCEVDFVDADSDLNTNIVSGKISFDKDSDTVSLSNVSGYVSVGTIIKVNNTNAFPGILLHNTYIIKSQLTGTVGQNGSYRVSKKFSNTVPSEFYNNTYDFSGKSSTTNINSGTCSIYLANYTADFSSPYQIFPILYTSNTTHINAGSVLSISNETFCILSEVYDKHKLPILNSIFSQTKNPDSYNIYFTTGSSITGNLNYKETSATNINLPDVTSCVGRKITMNNLSDNFIYLKTNSVFTNIIGENSFYLDFYKITRCKTNYDTDYCYSNIYILFPKNKVILISDGNNWKISQVTTYSSGKKQYKFDVPFQLSSFDTYSEYAVGFKYYNIINSNQYKLAFDSNTFNTFDKQFTNLNESSIYLKYTLFVGNEYAFDFNSADMRFTIGLRCFNNNTEIEYDNKADSVTFKLPERGLNNKTVRVLTNNIMLDSYDSIRFYYEFTNTVTNLYNNDKSVVYFLLDIEPLFYLNP
jgi:hypothetical protein